MAGGSRQGGVVDRVRPVGKGASRVGRPVRVVGLVGVGYRHALAVAVKPRERSQKVVRGVGDERRVVIGQDRPIVLQEVEQVGHHLQVRRDVRVVPEKMDVVETELHDVLYPVTKLAVRSAVRRGLVGPPNTARASGVESPGRRV